MQVRDLLRIKARDAIVAREGTEVCDAMRLLIENKISCLPVVDEDGRLVGIISDKDIFKAIYENQNDFHQYRCGELMTTDVIVGIEDDDIDYIAGVMTNNRIRHVPIVEEDRLIGLVSIGDVVKARLKDMEIENRFLKIYIHGTYPG